MTGPIAGEPPAAGQGLSCPVPRANYERISLGHGGGGRLTLDLIRRLFRPAFDNPALAEETDGARLNLDGAGIALSTDAYVVRPIFFPGGDIGRLAIHGTVNDLAACGARPRAVAAAFILEEGLPAEHLKRVVASMRSAASEAAAGLEIVCGDTKVIEHRSGGENASSAEPEPSGLMIVTTGLGERLLAPGPSPRRICPGDAILLTGPVGDHGAAVMAVREGIAFETPIVSDSRPLWSLVEALGREVDVHALRDPTRGGLATALNELASTSSTRFVIEESRIEVRPPVAALCEVLGLDPLYVACEGQMIVFVAADDAESALAALRRSGAPEAVRIGSVETAPRPEVILRTAYGALRPLDLLSGEQLPRIC